MNELQVKLVVFLVTVFFTLTIGYADAGSIIEFKKKYEINSNKVCGDKLCDEMTSASIPTRKNLHTPMAQYHLGIPLYQITCKSNLVLVLKVSNWHPACVKPESVQRLVDMNWAATLEEKNNILSSVTATKPKVSNPLEEFRKEYPLYKGFGLSITPDIIAGESYLIFEGYGWHGFHNVEIEIFHDSVEVVFMMSQTDKLGNLHLPWKIADSITSGLYHVHATDGIHDFDIDIPITATEK